MTNGMVEALCLIAEVKQALQKGTKHYRKSDNKLLTTPLQIITALSEEGSIYLEPSKS